MHSTCAQLNGRKEQQRSSRRSVKMSAASAEWLHTLMQHHSGICAVRTLVQQSSRRQALSNRGEWCAGHSTAWMRGCMGLTRQQTQPWTP